MKIHITFDDQSAVTIESITDAGMTTINILSNNNDIPKQLGMIRERKSYEKELASILKVIKNEADFVINNRIFPEDF